MKNTAWEYKDTKTVKCSAARETTGIASYGVGFPSVRTAKQGRCKVDGLGLQIGRGKHIHDEVWWEHVEKEEMGE
jgi:hypothetical protein